AGPVRRRRVLSADRAGDGRLAGRSTGPGRRPPRGGGEAIAGDHSGWPAPTAALRHVTAGSRPVTLSARPPAVRLWAGLRPGPSARLGWPPGSARRRSPRRPGAPPRRRPG